jgi:hypothetical protein
VTAPRVWQVEGSYFEACNCEAVCPCRRQGNRPGGRATYGLCDFALSWLIHRGRADDMDLSAFEVVLAGSFDADEPGSPWRVALYVDERADPAQRAALADIFLGRAGGTTLAYFARAIGEVHAVRAASIRLDHTAGRQRIQVDDYVAVRALEPVAVDEVVSCGIPGHDRPGTEMRTEVQRVDDPPLRWEVFGRCGFATDFGYNSDGGR